MTRADSELDAPNPDASARDPGERSRAQDGAFDHRCRTRVVYGPGTSDRTGALARELGGRRALLVTDPGVSRAGHADRVAASLTEAGVEVVRFDRVHENPTTRDVDECVAAGIDVDLVVGLGGGSSLDTAKGCNFLLTNGGRMADYRGAGRAERPMLPMIAIPTTAGTGSEVQSYALIADEATHQKMACGDEKAAPAVALLDPVLTTTLPRIVAACTGIDAIAHAVESRVTRCANAMSTMYARQSFRMTAQRLPDVLTDDPDLAARGDMLLGAALAGMAIEASMLGAAHSAANPLTAQFDVVHGRAVGVMLPHVVRFNRTEPQARTGYAELARDAGLAPADGDDDDAVDALVAHLHRLLRVCGFDRLLGDDQP
ncbi:MAG: alcohol dehydrogenase, partial [Phycisphaeraceae bacterium]|nr:alcohol dehydrogenase [Phycisphaeraceae bacterium]